MREDHLRRAFSSPWRKRCRWHSATRPRYSDGSRATAWPACIAYLCVTPVIPSRLPMGAIHFQRVVRISGSEPAGWHSGPMYEWSSMDSWQQFETPRQDSSGSNSAPERSPMTAESVRSRQNVDGQIRARHIDHHRSLLLVHRRRRIRTAEVALGRRAKALLLRREYANLWL